MQHLKAGKEEPGCPGVRPSASLGLGFPMCDVGSSARRTTDGKGPTLGLTSAEALGEGSTKERDRHSAWEHRFHGGQT